MIKLLLFIGVLSTLVQFTNADETFGIVDGMFKDRNLVFASLGLAAILSFNSKLWEEQIMPAIWLHVLNHLQVGTGRFMHQRGDPENPPDRPTEPVNFGKVLILIRFMRPLLLALANICYCITVFPMVNGHSKRHADRGQGLRFPDFRMMATFGDFPKHLGFGFTSEDNWLYFRVGSFSLAFMDREGSGRYPFGTDKHGNERKLAHHAICHEYENKMEKGKKGSLTLVFDCYLRRGHQDPKSDDKEPDYSRLTLKHVIEYLKAHKVLVVLDKNKMETKWFNKKNKEVV